MKKIVSIFVVVVLCFALMFPLTASAATASATLTGPSAVRAGDTITLSFNLNGSGILGASGTLSYDTNQLTLVGTTQKIASPWMVEFNGNNFVAYDNNLSNPINSSKTIFTVTFKVKNVAVGTNIKVSYTNVTATDGNADISVGTVSFQKTVAAPLSGENALASLNVSNATISPAFNANTTSYTASVPFSVSKLNVTATAKDSGATVTINSPTLTPGGKTNVTVTVKAANGATKTYTIAVTRESDPNYVASGNNKLSGIKVEGFFISPAFNSDVTEYIVWAPYETTSVSVSGTPADSKASVSVEGGDNLAAGQDNPVKVICTAENGDKKTYTVIVKRAAAHDGSVDDAPVITPDDTPTNTDPVTTGGIEFYWLIVVGVGALAIGLVIGLVIPKKNKE